MNNRKYKATVPLHPHNPTQSSIQNFKIPIHWFSFSIRNSLALPFIQQRINLTYPICAASERPLLYSPPHPPVSDYLLWPQASLCFFTSASDLESADIVQQGRKSKAHISPANESADALGSGNSVPTFPHSKASLGP